MSSVEAHLKFSLGVSALRSVVGIVRIQSRALDMPPTHDCLVKAPTEKHYCWVSSVSIIHHTLVSLTMRIVRPQFPSNNTRCPTHISLDTQVPKATKSPSGTGIRVPPCIPFRNRLNLTPRARTSHSACPQLSLHDFPSLLSKAPGRPSHVLTILRVVVGDKRLDSRLLHRQAVLDINKLRLMICQTVL